MPAGRVRAGNAALAQDLWADGVRACARLWSVPRVLCASTLTTAANGCCLRHRCVCPAARWVRTSARTATKSLARGHGACAWASRPRGVQHCPEGKPWLDGEFPGCMQAARGVEALLVARPTRRFAVAHAGPRLRSRVRAATGQRMDTRCTCLMGVVLGRVRHAVHVSYGCRRGPPGGPRVACGSVWRRL